MIKVAHYINNVDDGGAETLVKDYSINIDKGKFDFFIIVNQPVFHSANYALLKKNNVRIISLYKRWNIVIRAFNHFFKNKYIPYKLEKVLLKEKPDVLHIHMEQLSYVANVKKLPSGLKLFYTCHNIPEYHLKKYGDEYNAAKKLIKYNDLRFIVLHKYMREELIKLLEIKDAIVLNNGIDFSRFKDTNESKTEIRNSMNIPNNAFVIGSTARFTDVKNHDFLVEIFNEVVKVNKNAYLLLIGSGPLKQNIIDKLNNYGLLDKTAIFEHRTDMERVLKAMDVFMLVSFHEGFSISLIEAQKMGLKCVCSKNSSLYTDNVLSNKTFALDLKDPMGKWVDTITNNTIINNEYNDINDYNIVNVVKKLEKIYEE